MSISRISALLFIVTSFCLLPVKRLSPPYDAYVANPGGIEARWDPGPDGQKKGRIANFTHVRVVAAENGWLKLDWIGIWCVDDTGKPIGNCYTAWVPQNAISTARPTFREEDRAYLSRTYDQSMYSKDCPELFIRLDPVGTWTSTDFLPTDCSSPGPCCAYAEYSGTWLIEQGKLCLLFASGIFEGLKQCTDPSEGLRIQGSSAHYFFQ